jgi:hypothetical protein
VTGILLFFIPLWTMNGKEFFLCKQVYTIYWVKYYTDFEVLFPIKKRQNQFVGRLNIILNLILLGLFVYRSLNLSGETPAVSEKGIGMFLPVLLSYY